MKKRNERKDKTVDQGRDAADLEIDDGRQREADQGRRPRDEGRKAEADCPDREECRERFERECKRTCKRNFWTEMLRTCAKVAGVILAAFGLSSFNEED